MECLHIEGALAGELHGHGVGVLANAAVGGVDSAAAGVDLLGVHAVLGVQVLDLTVGEHAVEAGIGLELVAEHRGQGQALLLAGQLEKVGALAHDGGATSGHLEDLLLLALPGDDVELLNLSLLQQAAGGATEDGGRGVGVQGGGSPHLGLLLLDGGGLLGAHDNGGAAGGDLVAAGQQSGGAGGAEAHATGRPGGTGGNGDAGGAGSHGAERCWAKGRADGCTRK
mmetsp:Transcript_22390/g.56482  ORF Transcript_22390/g.56482 Transcript_22390/m.56482 type:complete len:226 (+) Transcript_22390:243-920(+)